MNPTDHQSPLTDPSAAGGSHEPREQVPVPVRVPTAVTSRPGRLRDRAGVWDGEDPTCIWLG